MGAAIGIITGGVTGNPVSIAVGAGVSVIAVFRAIFNIAQAIDAYNECVGGSGVNSEPIFQIQYQHEAIQRLPKKTKRKSSSF